MGYSQADWLTTSAPPQKGAISGVEEDSGVGVLVRVGAGEFVGGMGVGVGVLLGVGVNVSVAVGLGVGSSGVGVGSGGMRKLQDRINPIKSRLKGMLAQEIFFIDLPLYPTLIVL